MNFVRPARLAAPAVVASGPPPVAVAPAPLPAEASTGERPPTPDPTGTFLLLASLVLSAFMPAGRLASDEAHVAALVVGGGLALSVLCDLRRGVTNLIRADLLGLLSFYFLTFFEFLFPQANFDTLVAPEPASRAIIICLWAFAGLALGRHFTRGASQPFSELLRRPVPSSRMITIFVGCMAVGYLHMLVSVNFNFLHMIQAFVGPRFSQPWGRGKFGDWKALFVEIGAVLFLIPPMAGIILARRKNYSSTQLVIVLGGLLFTVFYGFSSGTRHIFDSYLVTFLIGYAFAAEKLQRKELVTMAAICATLLVISTVLMVRFRDIGLRAYLAGERQDPGSESETLSVDLNLYPMSRLAEVFPKEHPYLGWEIIYQALIRPIPRAIWTNKPEGMSLSIEDAVGAHGWTVAASFAGEAYMSGGLPVVFLISFGFGLLAAWWNRLASLQNSPFGLLIYASGFFSVVISMRSLLVFTTALLPTCAAIVGGYVLIAKGVKRIRQALPGRRAPLGPRPSAPVRSMLR